MGAAFADCPLSVLAIWCRCTDKRKLLLTSSLIAVPAELVDRERQLGAPDKDQPQHLILLPLSGPKPVYIFSTELRVTVVQVFLS